MCELPGEEAGANMDMAWLKLRIRHLAGIVTSLPAGWRIRLYQQPAEFLGLALHPTEGALHINHDGSTVEAKLKDITWWR